MTRRLITVLVSFCFAFACASARFVYADQTRPGWLSIATGNRVGLGRSGETALVCPNDEELERSGKDQSNHCALWRGGLTVVIDKADPLTIRYGKYTGVVGAEELSPLVPAGMRIRCPDVSMFTYDRDRTFLSDGGPVNIRDHGVVFAAFRTQKSAEVPRLRVRIVSGKGKGLVGTINTESDDYRDCFDERSDSDLRLEAPNQTEYHVLR